LDAITRNGTIVAVNIKQEFSLPLDWRFRTVAYEVTYQDGSREKVEESFGVESGSWTLDLRETIEKLAPDFDLRNPDRAARALIASKVGLEDGFTKLPGTRLAFRLPQGCKWSEKDKLFRDERLGTTLYAEYFLPKSLEQILQYIEASWRNPRLKRK